METIVPASRATGTYLALFCGSLRLGSTNHALLAAAEKLAPQGSFVEVYGGIGLLPHYTPDLDRHPLPEPVTELRALVRQVDGLIVSSPEYARGIPGAFKNALDWLVGGDELYGKPVAIWNASSRGASALEALKLVLSTLACEIMEPCTFTLPLLGRETNAEDLTSNPDTASQIRSALTSFVEAIQKRAAFK